MACRCERVIANQGQSREKNLDAISDNRKEAER